jgi:signal transduction histidine kinase
MDQSFLPRAADQRDLLRLAAQFTWRCGRDLRIDAFTPLDPAMPQETIRQLQGARLDRLAGKALYPPESRALVDVLTRQSSFSDISVTLPVADGRTLHVVLSASTVEDSSGAFCGYSGIGRAGGQRPFDVVQRQELAAMLRRAEIARDREARLRHESDVLLQSLRILHQPVPIGQKCRSVLDEFEPLLKFGAALVVRRGVKGALLTIVSTCNVDPHFAWPESPSVVAALVGNASIQHDIATEIDIRCLPHQLRRHARAALFVSLRIGTEHAVVIALRDEPGSFTDEHLAIMQRFALVAAQALEVEDQKAAVLNASKLAMLGELLATIAHEINQPLSIISMAAQNARLLVEMNASPEEVFQKLDTTEGQARRASEIVKAIRELAYPGRAMSALEDIDPAHVVDTLRTLCENVLLTKGISFDLHIPDDTRCIRARRGTLEQVLLNLISNAREAIVDQASRRQEKCLGRISITIDDAETAGRVFLRVADTGGGIPDDVIERIFDPFFTLKEVGTGTGLGLPICRTLLAEIGATLNVRNDAEGAVFEIVAEAAAWIIAPGLGCCTEHKGRSRPYRPQRRPSRITGRR